jgi:hypothetical protein
MRIQPTQATPTDTDDATQNSPTRSGRSRVRTGLSVAALAGVIVASGGATGLGHAFNAFANPNDTTCCGGSSSASA